MSLDHETLEFREYLYAMLGVAYYREPTREFIQAFATEDLFGLLPIHVRDTLLKQGLDLHLAPMDFANQEIADKDLESVQWDYFRMFIGPGMPLAPPWESVYRTEEKTVFGKQTLEVRAEYERFGLVVEHRNREPDDHIGLELEFMARLSVRCRECLLQGTTEGRAVIFQGQRDFLDDHLLQWVPKFCQDVHNNAETKFYAGIARLTEGFLFWDRDFLGMITH